MLIAPAVGPAQAEEHLVHPERLAHLASPQLFLLLAEPFLAQGAGWRAEPLEHVHRVLQRGHEPLFERADEHTVGGRSAATAGGS